LGFGFTTLVGRTSPSRHAVRSPERNSSNVGEVGFAVPRGAIRNIDELLLGRTDLL
jgi:hypothetical protein